MAGTDSTGNYVAGGGGGYSGGDNHERMNPNNSINSLGGNGGSSFVHASAVAKDFRHQIDPTHFGRSTDDYMPPRFDHEFYLAGVAERSEGTGVGLVVVQFI